MRTHVEALKIMALNAKKAFGYHATSSARSRPLELFAQELKRCTVFWQDNCSENGKSYERLLRLIFSSFDEVNKNYYLNPHEYRAARLYDDALAAYAVLQRLADQDPSKGLETLGKKYTHALYLACHCWLQETDSEVAQPPKLLASPSKVRVPHLHLVQ